MRGRGAAGGTHPALGTEESGAGEHSAAGWKGCVEDGLRGGNRGCGCAERSAAGVSEVAERAPREVDAYSAHIIVVYIYMLLRLHNQLSSPI